MKTSRLIFAYKYARLTPFTMIPLRSLSPPVVAASLTMIFNASSGGVAAYSAPPLPAFHSRPTSRDRQLTFKASPMLTSTQRVPIN